MPNGPKIMAVRCSVNSRLRASTSGTAVSNGGRGDEGEWEDLKHPQVYDSSSFKPWRALCMPSATIAPHAGSSPHGKRKQSTDSTQT